MRRIFLCCFSVGLDDMKRRDQRDEVKVLQLLREKGRFSVFEATANDVIAKTMDSIFNRKLVERVGGEYPWTKVKVTPAGEQVIDAAIARMRSEDGKGGKL